MYRVLLTRVLLLLALVPAPHASAASPPAMGLGEALAAAMRANPELGAAVQDSLQGGYRARETRAASWPALDLTAGYTRYDEPSIVLPIHEAGIFPPLDDDIYEGRLSLAVPLWDGGRRTAIARGEEATARAAGARLARSRDATVAGVAVLFVEARRNEDRAGIVAGRLEVLRRRRVELDALVAEGRASEADHALVVAALAEAVADSLATASGRRELAVRLGRLVGATCPVSPVPGAEAPARAEPPAHDPAKAGPAVREALARRERADWLHRAARRAAWPDLSGFAIWQARSGETLDFDGEWSVGLAVRVPLYTGGRLDAGEHAAAAARSAAEHRLDAARGDQATRLALASERCRDAELRRVELLAAAEAKARAVAAQRELQRQGRITQADLLARENELLALRLAATDMTRRASLALLDFHAATGSLTPDRALAILEEGP